MFLRSLRRYSKVTFEIGNSVETSSLSAEEGQFFSIKPLNGKYEAVKAPEGTVFYIPITRPSSFQISKSSFTFINFFSKLFFNFQLGRK